jgi:hypothetical protein
MREKTRTISVRGQNCDPLDENNDFILGVGSQTVPLWLRRAIPTLELRAAV